MSDVIQATVKSHNKTPGKLEWRVLIVDSQSMKMVSACTKMHELSAEGITSKCVKVGHIRGATNIDRITICGINF